MAQLSQSVITEDASIKKQQFDAGPKASHGYGGTFGVEHDRMDKVYVRWLVGTNLLFVYYHICNSHIAIAIF